MNPFDLLPLWWGNLILAWGSYSAAVFPPALPRPHYKNWAGQTLH